MTYRWVAINSYNSATFVTCLHKLSRCFTTILGAIDSQDEQINEEAETFSKSRIPESKEGILDKLFKDMKRNVYEDPFISTSTLDNEVIGSAKDNKYVSKMI